MAKVYEFTGKDLPYQERVHRDLSKLAGALELFSHEEYEVEVDGKIIHVDFMQAPKLAHSDDGDGPYFYAEW